MNRIGAALLQVGLVLERIGERTQRLLLPFLPRAIDFSIRYSAARHRFGGRVIDQGEPKVHELARNPRFTRAGELYGLRARTGARRLQALLIVDGSMDVVRLQSGGITYAVALLGNRHHAGHLNKYLPHYSAMWCFCFDAIAAGPMRHGRAAGNALPCPRWARTTFMFLPGGPRSGHLVRRRGQASFR